MLVVSSAPWVGVARRAARRVGRRRAGSSTRKAAVERVVAAVGRVPSWRMVTFSIIAHVDHGKSSLSQRLLERQGNVEAASETRQSALDTLAVERARGITVKAATATMVYDGRDGPWLVTLVDTPGHADFAHEVRRSLACCDGALLLVDASQGVEAQTLSAASAAREAGVRLLAACSKCDLETADPDEVSLSLASAGVLEDPESALRVSAKTGEGVDGVLPAVVDAFASGRRRDPALPLRARVVDARYDATRGVVCVVQVVDGTLREQQRVRFASRPDEAEYGVQEVGVLTPEAARTGSLPAGAVGYVVCGLRDVRQATVGDTMAEDAASPPLEAALPAADRLLYASVFPPDGALLEDMAKAVDRLALNDASVSVAREPPRPTLGAGLRLGFRGLLHMDVFRQRLRDEFDEDVLFCAPLVPYRLVSRADPTRLLREIHTLDLWPSPAEEKAALVLEPTVRLDVLVPLDALGAALDVLEPRCTRQLALDPSPPKAALRYEAPWAAVVDGLSEALAHATRGLATLAVDPPTWLPADLVKVDLALNGLVVDALSVVERRPNVLPRARKAVANLKEHVPRQQFEVVIQAKVANKILARERIPPFRKDVLTTKAGKNVGGGDVSRKKKLLDKQKAGKARQKTVGNVTLSQDSFWAVLATGPGRPSRSS